MITFIIYEQDTTKIKDNAANIAFQPKKVNNVSEILPIKETIYTSFFYVVPKMDIYDNDLQLRNCQDPVTL